MSLQSQNAQRWAVAKLTRASEYKVPVTRILAAKDRYKQIETRTGVHWVFVACSHYRESNLNFDAQLGQGDPLNRVSTHVPKGRGPFASFEDSAVDALVNCAPYAAKQNNWSMPDMLTVLEAYNGLGYYHKGMPSPYVWSGTDQYVKGKYVADGVFDPNVVDKQLGVAGLILCLLQADPTISFPPDPDGDAPVYNPLQPHGPSDDSQHTIPNTPKTPVVLPEPHKPIPTCPAAKGLPEPPKAKVDGFSAVWEWLRAH